MPLTKGIAVSALMCLLGACSTLSELSSNQSSNESVLALNTAELKVSKLEQENAQLRKENAQLANQILAMAQKERKVSAAEKAATNAEEELAEESELKDPPAMQTALVAPPEAADVVVDEAEAPELRGADVVSEEAPRLVQPTFASSELVFENEAIGEIPTSSVLFGVHLASYRKIDEAQEGWRKLQRENPDELGLLEPRIEKVDLPKKGLFLRLIGGGFSNKSRAAALCGSLKEKGLFCSVSGFEGDRLPPPDAG